MTMDDLLALLRDTYRMSEFIGLFGYSFNDDGDWDWHDVSCAMADKIEEALRER